MKRNILTVIMLLAIALTAAAIPAKRGITRTVTLDDGTSVSVELMGDEHVHYWKSADGRTFIHDAQADRYVPADVTAMAAQREQALETVARKAAPRRAAGTQPADPLIGEMNGLIILVQFSDTKFKTGHDATLYNDIVNAQGFTNSMGFKGSVRDYFLSQSDGQLDYKFDIAGPVTLSHGYAYYGGNDAGGSDKNLKGFVQEALEGVGEDIDFSKYDNDNDGYVDQVFLLYAGKGEADSYDSNAIWPHMFYAYNGHGIDFVRNGVRVDVYACSNEMATNTRINGIGAICHEFSHCLGLPDMYDTGDVGNYGTGSWDLMNSGCYLGNSFTPCGYTAYERAYCGWRPLVELTEEMTLENLAPISAGGSAYAFYNDENPNEYYIFEPRATVGSDVSLPNSGLLIYHVDYSASAWRSNTVNNAKNHQRCAIVAADNMYGSMTTNIKNDAFPYSTNNSFNDNTTPAASWFNKNSVGTTAFRASIDNITRNSDRTVSFKFTPAPEEIYEPVAPEGSVFYESFGRCYGVGGNDNVFVGMTNLATFKPDHEEWYADHINGANGCALVGSNSTASTNVWVSMPWFHLEEGQAYKLTFKAAPYSLYTHDMHLETVDGDCEYSVSTFPMPKSTWTDHETILRGSGDVKLMLVRDRPYYIDEFVLMPVDDAPDGITSVTASHTDSAVYNLAGQRIHGAYKGIVIRNGKKTF